MEMAVPKIQRIKIIVEGEVSDIKLIVSWLDKQSKELGFKYLVTKDE